MTAQPAGSTGSRRPVKTRGDIREAALLEIAERLLAAGSFESASLEQIATDAGISRSTFYFYFDSKQALLVRLVELTLDQLASQIDLALRPATAEPAQAVRSLMRHVAKMWWEHRSVLMAAADLAGSAPSVFERVRDVAEGRSIEVAHLLSSGGGGPLVSDIGRAERLATALGWMAERNFYVLAREEPTRAQLDALADQLSEIALAAAGYQTEP